MCNKSFKRLDVHLKRSTICSKLRLENDHGSIADEDDHVLKTTPAITVDQVVSVPNLSPSSYKTNQSSVAFA